MAQEITGVRGVTKNYGVRRSGGANGQYKSTGPVKTLSFKINRDWLVDAENGAIKLNSFVWEGISVVSAKLVVKKVFDATSAFTLSTATQGTLPVAATELGSVGVVTLTPTGKLASGEVTTATEDLSVTGLVNGTGAGGEAELIVEYLHTELP